MLEGKEVDGKIGELGGYFVDVSDNGDLEIGVSIKVNLFDELDKLAEKKDLGWLKKGVDFLRTMTGNSADEDEPPEEPAPEEGDG